MKWKRWLRTFESRWGRSGGRGGGRGGCFDWEGGRLPTAGGGSQHPGTFERDHGPGRGGHSVVEKPWEKKMKKNPTSAPSLSSWDEGLHNWWWRVLLCFWLFFISLSASVYTIIQGITHILTRLFKVRSVPSVPSVRRRCELWLRL